MKTYRLNKTTRGWFIGNFPKAVYKTDKFEVAVKIEKKGDKVKEHYHKKAAEITLVVEGRVRFKNKVFIKGDIVLLKPGERCDFEVLEDAVTVIVKTPAVKNDKYYTEQKNEKNKSFYSGS